MQLLDLYPIDLYSPMCNLILHIAPQARIHTIPQFRYSRIRQAGLMSFSEGSSKLFRREFMDIAMDGGDEEVVQAVFPVLNLRDGKIGILGHQLIRDLRNNFDLLAAQDTDSLFRTCPERFSHI